MDKNLPRVYANPINKKVSNNREYSVSKKEAVKKEVNVPKKINEIFNSPSHVYKSTVRIKLKDGEIEAVIVGKTGNNLLTLKGDKININDIEDIDKI